MCAKKASVKKPAAAKAAKPKARKPSKNELLEEKAKLFDRIRAKEKERRKLLSRFDQLTKERKAAKEALGFCETEICGLGYALDEKHPLFDQAQRTEEAKPAADSKPAETASAKPADKDGWKALPLADLKLPQRIEKAILDAGHATLGALVTHMTEQSDWWAKQIKGIGEKGHDAVCDAFTNFWADHPEYCDIAKQEAA